MVKSVVRFTGWRIKISGAQLASGRKLAKDSQTNNTEYCNRLYKQLLRHGQGV